MLAVKNVTKKFGDKVALDNLSFNIPTGSVFGLIGSNGSGKSTLLRIISGVYEADEGSVEIDGVPTFENTQIKGECFFISDFPYFYNNSTVENIAELYRELYPNWSEIKFQQLCATFPIGIKDRIINMSKGMQRQAALMLAISTCPQYLLLDEIFDGLDPVVRQLIKKLIIEMVVESRTTVIIASHNLRELEDVCDHVGLLHRGGILMEKELDEAKLGIHRVQIVLNDDVGEGVFSDLNVVKVQRQGKLYELTVKGEYDSVVKNLSALDPIYMEMLPLTLEEVFISEMEVAGYDIDNIIK